MLNIKRLSLALIALSLNTPAFAADCCNSKVLVPSQHGGFKVGIDALYLRPNTDNANLNYGTTVFSPLPSILGPQTNLTVDSDYDWGVYAQVGYLFPCTGNDLTVGYTYLNSNNTASSVAPPGTGVLSIFTNGFITLSPFGGLAEIVIDNGLAMEYSAADTTANFTLSAIDLEAGQRFTSGSYDMRMFAGLRYAHITETLNTTVQFFPQLAGDDDYNYSTAGNQAFDSQFRGAGPRIGIDTRYCLGSGFGIDANFNTALLVGTADNHYNAVVTDSIRSNFPQNFACKNSSSTRVVPVLEAKLGADYTYIMDCRRKSTLVLEAGYQISSYFNTLDQTQVVNPRPSDNSLAPIFFNGNTSDVSFDGVYLGVKYYA